MEDGRRRQSEACAVLGEFIGAWMVAQQEAIERGRRPAPVMSLYEQLVVEHGIARSYKAVLRYVRRREEPWRIRPSRRVEVLALDDALATAILDRLLYHCHVVQIDGRSFSLREIEKQIGDG